MIMNAFKWSIVRYLNPADHNPARITKADQDFAKNLDFKNIKFPVKIRNIHKILEKNSISISVFGYGNKTNIQFMYQKNIVEKNMLIYYSYEKNERDTLFLSQILILSCMIILYTVQKNIFVIIVYKLLVQKKY